MVVTHRGYLDGPSQPGPGAHARRNMDMSQSPIYEKRVKSHKFDAGGERAALFEA